MKMQHRPVVAKSSKVIDHKQKQIVSHPIPHKKAVNDSGIGLDMGRDHLDSEFEKF
jgi:hypothetical protein